MPVKYECPRCGRRFTEWGAEKHGFKCPGDKWCPEDRPDEIELVRMGTADDRGGKRPSLKRHVRRPATVAPVPVPDDEDLSSEVVDEDEGEDEDGGEVLLDDEEEIATASSDNDNADAEADDSEAPLADDEEGEDEESSEDLLFGEDSPAPDDEPDASAEWGR